MIPTVNFALEREERIRGFVLQNPYSSTTLIHQHFFPSAYGSKKAREVLTRMVKVRKTLNRFRYGYEYLYHIGKRSSQWLHMHDVTMFHFDLQSQLKGTQRITYHKREYEYHGGRADGLYIIIDDKGNGVKFFLEMDDMQNEFDKIAKYEEYFRSRAWEREVWADPLKKGVPRFPTILIVTNREISRSDKLRVITCTKKSNYMEAVMYEK